MKEELEYSMYGLVPYNISPIQQGIQFGHAVQEYNNDFFERSHEFAQWRFNDKTFIILNGGTTNRTVKTFNSETGIPNYKGTLNNHVISLANNGIECATFFEPDLNDALTAVVFLVDERVFNKEKYPDYIEYPQLENMSSFDELPKLPTFIDQIKYEDWVESVGGEKNVFLREFLSQFKLA